MQKNFELSTGQLSQEFRRDLVIVGAELVAWGVRFDREFEFGVFMMGKWLRLACFPISLLPIIPALCWSGTPYKYKLKKQLVEEKVAKMEREVGIALTPKNPVSLH